MRSVDLPGSRDFSRPLARSQGHSSADFTYTLPPGLAARECIMLPAERKPPRAMLLSNFRD